MVKETNDNVYKDIIEETLKELQSEQNIAIEQFNEVYKQKFTIMNWLKRLLIQKILGNFHLEIKGFIGNKEVFSVTIPNKKS